MQSIDFLDAEMRHHPLFHHDPAPADHFFGWLKYQNHPACEIPCFRQISRRAQKHGRMTVMAAGMHTPLYGRGPIKTGFFLHRKGIHIGPQSGDRSFALAVNYRDHTAFCPARVNLVHAEFLQPVNHKGCRLLAIKGQFGMLVQMPPPVFHILCKSRDSVYHRHGWTPCAGLVTLHPIR